MSGSGSFVFVYTWNLKSSRPHQLMKNRVSCVVSTPAGAWSISHRSTLGPSMKWFSLTSSTLDFWSLYACWNNVSGAGSASPDKAPKNWSSNAASAKVTWKSYV